MIEKIIIHCQWSLKVYFIIIYGSQRERRGGEGGGEVGRGGRGEGETDRQTLICSSTYLRSPWLILVCALTRIKPKTLASQDDALIK